MKKYRLTQEESHSSLGSKWSVSDLSSFYVSHRANLVRHAEKILKDSHRAEEVVQDALIKVILAAPELNSEGQAFSYIRKTIDNLCLDIFRLEGRRPNLVLLDEVSAENESSLQQSTDHADEMVAAEDAAIIRQALAMLSPAERAALVMWEIEGRSTEEISRELGIKEATVRHTVSRARNSLRRVLTDFVIDEKRGLTALDLLSVTYKRSVEITKKSSRAALSLILLVFAYLGFVNVPDTTHKFPVSATSTKLQKSSSELTTTARLKPSRAGEVNPKSGIDVSQNSGLKTVNAKASQLSFAGLDKNGIPTGFTVTDNMDSLGSLYFVGRDKIGRAHV